MKPTQEINIPELASDIPALPVVASRILQIIADETASLEELKKVISLDQAFTTRLLRVANSPYYRAQSTIANITDAITRIGFTTVQALVFAISLRDLRRSADTTDRMLWEHNLAVSVSAGLVARTAGYASFGDIMIYGLLHDIGKVFINLSFKESYAEIIQRVHNQKIPCYEAEQAVLGYDHADVGRHVAQHWRLPQALVFAIANHHEPDILELSDTELKRKTMIVKAADALCPADDTGITRAGVVTDAQWQFLKLGSPKKREALCDEIEKEVQTYRDFVLGGNAHS